MKNAIAAEEMRTVKQIRNRIGEILTVKFAADVIETLILQNTWNLIFFEALPMKWGRLPLVPDET